jgi:hypothetical protein
MRAFINRTSLAAIASFTLLATGALTAPPALAAPNEGCPNEQVRAESDVNPTTGQPYSQDLAECRAYEMVSPLEKQQHDAVELGKGTQPLAMPVSPEGDAVGWQSQGDFAGAGNYGVQGFGPANPYVSERSAGGWTTRSAFPPAGIIEADISLAGELMPQGVLLSPDLTGEAGCGFATRNSGYASGLVCAAREGDGSWLPAPRFDSLLGELSGIPSLEGASADLTSAVVQMSAPAAHFLPSDTSPLTTGCVDDSNCHALYELFGIGGPSPQLRQVDLDNNGAMIGPEDAVGVGAVRASGQFAFASGFQAVSRDGSKIFFTATPDASNDFGSSTNVPTVFARVNGATTVDLSNPSPSECTRCTREAEEGEPETSEAKPAVYQGASADGSKVFFTTTQQLVNADTDSGSDLYEYDFDNSAAERIVQVSGGGPGDLTPGAGAGFESVVSISEDGAHVYFIATGILTTLPNGTGQSAALGQHNLYGYDSETGETKFVATLSPQDSVQIGLQEQQGAQVSPNGRYLVFDSYARLAGDDTNGGQAVYRYDFDTGELIWISHGAPNMAPADEGIDATVAIKPSTVGSGALPTAGDANRAISDEGSYIVFSTAERLQASDVNGASNVYLWHNGTVSMISDGHDPAGASYPVISASGADVFFETRERLIGQDTDAFGDIYDARIDGGFPAPTPEPSCASEACRGAPSAPPTFSAPATAAFSGGGNLTPASTSFPPVTEPKPKPKPLTKAQLARALRQCRKDRRKVRRSRCERAARKR